MKKHIRVGRLAALVLSGITLFPLSVYAAEQEVTADMQVVSVEANSAKNNLLLAKMSTSTVVPPAQDEKADDLRLSLAKVVLFAETGKFDQAFALIKQLKKENPDNSHVLAAEADLNSRIGNYNSAFIGLNKAVLLDPSDEDILEQQRAAAYSKGANVLGGFTFRRTDLAYEQLSRATTQFAVTPTISAIINVENDHLHSREPIMRVDGSPRNYRDNEQRGFFMLNKVFENNDEVSGSLYANTFTAGLGAQYSWWTYNGVTRVRGEYNRPDWDYAEMVIERGTKSDFHLERKQIFTNNFNATIGGGYNHYALDDVSDAAQGLGWDANIEYTQSYNFFGNPENEVNFSANYTTDAEYFTYVNKRGPASARFKPLSASDYEVHAINISASKKLSSRLFLGGYGGYSVNRLNGANGPLYGGSLDYPLSDSLDVEFRASHTESGGENNSQKEDQLGLNIKWIL